MAEVGVLELSIRDNSTEAAGGLGQLTQSLSGASEAAKSFKLGTVKNQIASIVDAVKDNNKTVAALGTLFNAIANFSKISVPKIDVQPIQEIKDTLGSGWNLGQAGTQLNKIREAFSQEWNTENAYNMNYALVSIAEGVNSVSGTSIKSVANNLGNLADKMNEFADAASKMASSSGAHDIFMQAWPSIQDVKSLGTAVPEGYSIAVKQGKEAVTSAVADMVNAGIETGRETQDSHSPSRVYEQLGVDAAEGYINGLRSKLADVTAAVSAFVRSAIQSSQEAMPMAAPEVAAAIRSAYSTALKDSNLPEAAKEVILKAAEEAASFTNALATSAPKEAFSDVASMASSFTRSIMTTTTEGALDYSEQFIGDFQQINNEVQTAGDSIHNEVTEEIQQAAEKTETLCDNIQYFSRVLGEIPKAKPLYSSLEDAFNGIRDGGRKVEGDLTSSWLHGQGNKHENLYALKTMAHEFGMTVDEVKQKVAELLAAEQALAASGNGSVPGLQNVGSATQGMTEFSASVENGKKTSSELTGKLKSLDGELKSKKKDTDQASSGFANFKSSLEKAFPAINTLKNRLKTVLTRQIAMKLINAITSGFSEGIQNLYNYSKVMSTEFKPTMDSAASSILYMKNSLGASLAPVITALVPVLRTVINWFVTLINYVNQFFALLNGQSTWTKALETQTEAYKDQTKAAKGASSAAKDLLADWDELNIIQSNSGGGGGGGSSVSTPDYASMFEEVGVFEGWLADLVDGIKNQFGNIWNLVKKIGVAILGWKFSKAFSGLLGTLGSIVAGAQIIDLVFELSTMFTNKYLDTGEKGWLVADVLMTAVGSVLARKVLSKVLAGEAGLIPIPITFAISALATIFANVGRTDVSALSEKSIAASVTAALEGGVAGGFLAHLAGYSLGTSLLGGAAAAIATFGVAIGLKADAQVSAEGITKENIVAKLESIAALGIGGAIVGAKAASIMGVSVAAGAAGMAMLFGGAPIATLGVAIGINAINEVVDGRAITASVIKKNFLAGGLVGAGIAIGAVAVGVTGLVGIAAGALTVGALFAIEAYIASQPVSIQWGNYVATEEEIKAYVQESVFKTDPKIAISLVNAAIEPLGSSKRKLESDIEKVIGTMHSVPLGLKEGSLDDIRTDIDQLVTDFNDASNQYQNTLEVALNLVPVKNAEGEDKTKEIIGNSNERWKELNGIMEKLGTDLADAYKVAYDARLAGNIDETAEATITKITQMMSDVAQAIATGSARAKASHAIEKQMGNLSADTMEGILDEVEAQKEELIKSLKEAREDAAEGILAQQYAYEELAKYRLKEVGGDESDELYKHYVDQANQAAADYKLAMENLSDQIDEAANNFISPAQRSRLHQQLMDVMKLPITGDDFNVAKAGLADSLQYLINSATGEINTDEMQKYLNEVLSSAYGKDNARILMKGIKNGFLSYGDIFDSNLLNQMFVSMMDLPGSRTEEFKQNFLKYVKETMNINGYDIPEQVYKPYFKMDDSEIQKIADQEKEILGDTFNVDELFPNATQAQKDLIELIHSTYNLDNVNPNDLTSWRENIFSTLISTGVGSAEDITYALDAIFGNYKAPEPDFTAFDSAVSQTEQKADDACRNIQSSFNSLTANSPDIDVNVTYHSVATPGFSAGGFPKSGDLVMANENGNFEMMGRMGNQPVVANNQQIVSGISSGVAQANSGVESRLSTIEGLLNRILSKEFTAKAVPTSGWGQHATRSAAQYDRVTGG